MISKEIADLLHDQKQGFALVSLRDKNPLIFQLKKHERIMEKNLVSIGYQYYKILGHWKNISNPNMKMKLYLIPAIDLHKKQFLTDILDVIDLIDLKYLKAIISLPRNQSSLKISVELLDQNLIKLIEPFCIESDRELVLDSIERPGNALGRMAFSARGQLF